MTLKDIEIILTRYRSLYKAALNDNAEISQVNFIEVYEALDFVAEALGYREDIRSNEELK